MPRRMTPYKTGDLGRLVAAQEHLRIARDLCAAAGAPRAVRALNIARKSLEGAIRHAAHRRTAGPYFRAGKEVR